MPFEVHWSAKVNGGMPPYVIYSPAGVASLTDAGYLSGIVLFNTNKGLWDIVITAEDRQGQNATARTVLDNTILVGSTLSLNGARFVNDSTRFAWEQIHNPDRYDGSEYVTGNDAEIQPGSSNPTVNFQWPRLYRFSLRATRPDGTEPLYAVDVLVGLSKSPFKLKGAALTLFNEGQLLQSNLDRIVSWGGNLAALHFNLYVPDPNANMIVPSWKLNASTTCPPPPTPTDEMLESWIGLAHQRELSVLLVPHVVYIGCPTESGYTRSTWIEVWQFKPADRTEWFRNYKTWILHYAGIVERTGVEIFSLGADLGEYEYVPNVWKQMIREVRNVYHGKITVTEALGWGYDWHRDPPDFLQDIDLMDFDFNYAGSANQLHPSVSDMAERFSEFMQGNHRWMSVPYMRKYGKPWLVNALGLPNGDGVNRYLQLHGERPEEGPLRVDNQEQVDYVEAGFRALSELARSKDGDLLLGVVIWSLTDWEVPRDFVDWSVAGRPVEGAIQLWFCGQGRLEPIYEQTFVADGDCAISKSWAISQFDQDRVFLPITLLDEAKWKLFLNSVPTSQMKE